MKLFKLDQDYGYASVSVEGNGESIFLSKLGIKDNMIFRWEFDLNEPIPDVTILLYEILVCNERARDTLICFDKNLKVEKIRIGPKDFYAFVDIPIIEDALNLRSSRITYFSTGDIKEVEKCVFKEGAYPLLFQIPEIVNTIFCTKEFKEIVNNNLFTGLTFTECKVQPKSWFRR